MVVRYARAVGGAVVPLESEDQEAVFAWAKTMRIEWPVVGVLSTWMFAIPNGQMLAGNSAQRARMMNALKKRGFRVGASDIFLAIPRGGYHGAFIEMKRKGATASSVSREQIAFQTDMTRAGYWCTVGAGYDDAVKCILTYLKQEIPRWNGA